MNEHERIWLDNAARHGGGFVSAFADACFKADDENFSILRTALERIMAKYPKYSK